MASKLARVCQKCSEKSGHGNSLRKRPAPADAKYASGTGTSRNPAQILLMPQLSPDPRRVEARQASSKLCAAAARRSELAAPPWKL